MRADRLLSLLMLLQTRGRMTAVSLAQELEVSERTIYRDINALSVAGVPVYGQPGRDGGYALLDSYRTNLTGLTEGEAQALFMLTVPDALTQLGIDQTLKAALRKLAASLPDTRRSDEARVRQRFHLDSALWQHGEESIPHLPTVHQAVWQDCQLYLTYRLPYAIDVEHLVKPYGLVAKAGHWYLVYERDGLRVHRVSHLLDARLSDEAFERPASFDLPAFWQDWRQRQEAWRVHYSATVRVAPHFVAELPRYFGSNIRDRIETAVPSTTTDGIILELHFESLEAARERILGLGNGVEVLEPRALRASVQDFAAQIVALYAG